jgi:hypothetical protein
METMRKFNVGEEVKVVEITLAYAGNLKVGDTAIIKKFQLNKNRFVMLVGDDSNAYCWHDVNNIEIAKPKWTIYNNTLPWSQLSDNQKGKMLLAAHQKMLFIGAGLQVTGVALNNAVYKVEEVAKPEPTMAELFLVDWQDTVGTEMPEHFADKIIAKGWTKSCK